MAVALTTIQHGKEDGTVVVVPEGEEVKGLPADVVKDLEDQGLVGELPKTQAERDEDRAALESENDDLRKQVEALQAELAKAQKK